MIRYILKATGEELSREEYRSGRWEPGTVSVETGEFEPSIVDQADVINHDLGTMVERWTRGEPVPVFQDGQFGDVSEVHTFQEVQQKLIDFEAAFMTVPPKIREHFHNDPVEFVEAMVDPSRRGEMLSLGLYKAAEEKPPVEAASPRPSEGPPGGAGPGGAGSGSAAS